MFTQCRGCGEIFAVSADDLVIAKGQVRCNVCGTVFNALETLSEQPPQEDEDLFLHQSESAPPLLTRSHIQHEPPETPDFVEETVNTAPLLEPIIPELSEPEQIEHESIELQPEEIGTVATEQSVYLDQPELDQPEEIIIDGGFMIEESFMDEVPEKKPAQTPANTSLWLGLSAAALLLLGWQSIAAIRSGSLPLPVNSVSDSICDFLACQEVKKTIDLQAVSLVSRNIRQHPGQDEALIISASMINANKKNRDFPAIEIILSDLDGKPMAMRRFLPQEYLPEDILRSGFISDVLIPISLEISSPGDRAVAFEIDFVQP
ncbi:zinc-ribbon and DUF3426 domain-containing protein [Marinicella sp. W31]|uniref:zinc-ribbon and DUF3426 domain-containing protein n=1 Tax=Marinicella sp. W31 TaxID=3023713 RepID=UPI00375657F0